MLKGHDQIFNVEFKVPLICHGTTFPHVFFFPSPVFSIFNTPLINKHRGWICLGNCDLKCNFIKGGIRSEWRSMSGCPRSCYNGLTLFHSCTCNDILSFSNQIHAL